MKQLTKRNHILLVVLGVFFVFYNIILFTISGFTGLSAAFWLSYVFMLLCLALNACARLILFKDRLTAKDWFFSYPILRHGYIYLIAEFISSVLFMAIPNANVRIAAVVQLLILLVYLVFAISCFFAKEKIEELDEKIKEKVLFIRSTMVDLQTIASLCSDITTKAMISKLSEKMRYSDPMSHESLSELERGITLEIALLRSIVEAQDFSAANEKCSAIDRLLDERNRKCKIMK